MDYNFDVQALSALSSYGQQRVVKPKTTNQPNHMDNGYSLNGCSSPLFIFSFLLNECQLLKKKTCSLNPIALRMAKTPLTFSCSECNRVNGRKSFLLRIHPSLEWHNCPPKQTGCYRDSCFQLNRCRSGSKLIKLS